MTNPDIRIRYTVLKVTKGYLPIYFVNGRQHGDTFGVAYPKGEARDLAKAMAEAEAAHYAGDWNVTVAPVTGRLLV